jgi:LuxR family maltose regulon positive regulatory protein
VPSANRRVSVIAIPRSVIYTDADRAYGVVTGLIAFTDKTRVPARAAEVVRRQRLLDQLHAQIDRRLLLISAPGGYGKTTLLLDFASDAGFPVVWYTLETSDNDLRTFAGYLVSAIQQEFPRFGSQTRELIDSNPDRPLDVRQFVSTLAHEIEHQAGSFFALILDDYHAVSAAEEVNQAVDLLLAHLPENCRLIVSGRSIPAKLRLTRLAAQQQVTGLGANDLAFNVEEIQELVQRRFEVELSTTEAEELREHSHGWITAVLLSGSLWSKQLARRFPQFTNSATDLFNYLTEEVLSLLDRDTQEFVLGSSILSRIDPNQCDRVLDREDSEEVLEELSRTLLFISRSDAALPVYRFHPVFQEYLQGKLREEEPERYAALHRAAGEAAEADGDQEGAIEYFLKGGHGDEAARLIEIAAPDLIQKGKWLTLRDWFRLLEGDTLQGRPALGLIQAQVLSWTGETDRALLMIREAQRLFTQRGETALRAEALLIQSRIVFERGDHTESGRLAAEALELLPSRELVLQSQCHERIGISLRHQGQILAALTELKQALGLANEAGELPREAWIQRNMASVYLASDQLEDAETSYRAALTIWQQVGDVAQQAACFNGLAIVSERRGNYEESARLYRDALQKVRDAGSYPYLEANISRNLAEQAVDLTHYQEALRLCEEALGQVRSLEANWLLAGLEVVRSRAWLHLGRVTEADRAARSAHRLARRFGSLQYIGMALCCMACTAAAGNREHDAAGYFERSVRIFKRAKAFRELARTEFWYAISLAGWGDLTKAKIMLRASADLAVRIGQETLLVVEASHDLEQVRRAFDTIADDRRIRDLSSEAEVWRKRHAVQPAAASAPAMPLLVAQAFGPPEVVKGGILITSSEWETSRAKELFFLLLTHPGGLRKEQIITELWPETSDARGNSLFHSTLYRVRRAVSSDCVVFSSGRYRMNPSLSLWSDVGEFQRLLNGAFRLPQDSPEMAEQCRQAVGLYRGPYMEGFYSEWSQNLQEKLQGRYLQALARLARFHDARAEFRESLDYGEMALAVDNTLEAVHLQVMQLHARRGDPALAVQHYVTYTQWLRRELDEEPSGQLRRAYEALLQGVSPPHLPVRKK